METESFDLTAIAKKLAPMLQRMLRLPDLAQLRAVMAGNDMSLSPRSKAAIYANSRDRFIPAIGTAPSNVIASLPANSTSSLLTISSDRIAKGFKVTLVTLDAGTSYNSLVMNVYVGSDTTPRYQFSGAQLNPATNNGCVAQACQMRICAGIDEDIKVSFTNVSSVDLDATARVRVQGNILLAGDPEFAGCWGDEVTAHLIAGKSPGEGCGCQVPGAVA